MAYNDLCTCRQVECGFIPWTAKISYCNEYGIEGVDRDDFVTVMRQVDQHYLEWLSAEREKKHKQSTKGKGKQIG